MNAGPTTPPKLQLPILFEYCYWASHSALLVPEGITMPSSQSVVPPQLVPTTVHGRSACACIGCISGVVTCLPLSVFAPCLIVVVKLAPSALMAISIESIGRSVLT